MTKRRLASHRLYQAPVIQLGGCFLICNSVPLRYLHARDAGEALDGRTRFTHINGSSTQPQLTQRVTFSQT